MVPIRSASAPRPGVNVGYLEIHPGTDLEPLLNGVQQPPFAPRPTRARAAPAMALRQLSRRPPARRSGLTTGKDGRIAVYTPVLPALRIVDAPLRWEAEPRHGH